MGVVTVNLPIYPELGLVTLNLQCELLTKCGLGQYPRSKQLLKFMAGRD